MNFGAKKQFFERFQKNPFGSIDLVMHRSTFANCDAVFIFGNSKTFENIIFGNYFEKTSFLFGKTSVVWLGTVIFRVFVKMGNGFV